MYLIVNKPDMIKIRRRNSAKAQRTFTNPFFNGDGKNRVRFKNKVVLVR